MAVEATAAGAATSNCACAVGSETSPLIVAISLDASADKPVVVSPSKSGVKFAGVMPANTSVNWLDAASASSGVPPAAMTSLNAVNAVLFVLAALAALLKVFAALTTPEMSPVLVNWSNACVMRKADEASLASLLPVNVAAASANPA